MQPLGGALGYILGGGAATFGSFAEFLGQENPLARLTAMEESSGGGGGGGALGESVTYEQALAFAYFGHIDFSQFGNGGPIPKRKYLKQQSKAYFGAIESIDQYQLDHSNWIDEYQGTMDFLGDLKDYFDSAGGALGGAGYGNLAFDNLKTVKDLVEKFKNFNPSFASAVSAITGVVGTSISMEGDRFGQIIDIYRDANDRYDQLHKKNPMLDKGVTVNINVIIGTNGGGYTNIMIYDISTHRYLSGGKILHRIN